MSGLKYKFVELINISKNEYSNVLSLLSQLTYVNQKLNIEQFEKLIEYLKETKTHKIWCIYYEDKLISMITTILEPKIIQDFKKVLHVEDFVVDKDFRKKGVGSYILERVKNYAKSQNAYKIILNCSPFVALFYEKQGYKHNNQEMSLYI